MSNQDRAADFLGRASVAAEARQRAAAEAAETEPEAQEATAADRRAAAADEGRTFLAETVPAGIADRRVLAQEFLERFQS